MATPKSRAVKRVRKPAAKRVPAAAASKRPTSAAEHDEPPASEFSCFQDGGGKYPNFKFFRFWWRGEGERPSIIPQIEKKLRPGDDPQFGVAAKFDLLLPDNAPGDYLDLAHLLARYEHRQQPWEQIALGPRLITTT